MEFSSNQPIYLQVATWLEQQILEGKYPIGHKIPGVRDLAVHFDCQYTYGTKCR